jgi:hypothetical protein
MHGLVYGVIRVVREFMVNCLTWMQTPSVLRDVIRVVREFIVSCLTWMQTPSVLCDVIRVVTEFMVSCLPLPSVAMHNLVLVHDLVIPA